jgi:DNA-binding LytR/AlgR family response regulator
MFLIELGYEVTGLLPRAEEALAHIEENQPDIILLDIQLKGNLNGIEFATSLQKINPIPIIFLTANSDDATFEKAKAAKPYAFLAKPFKKTELQRALELTISLMANRDQAILSTEKPAADQPFILSDRIFVRHKEKMVKIIFDTILYVEADRNYCKVFTPTKEYLLTVPMKTLEYKLPSMHFQRIHRSFIVNLSKIDEVDNLTIVIDKKVLPLSKSHSEELLMRLKMV